MNWRSDYTAAQADARASAEFLLVDFFSPY